MPIAAKDWYEPQPDTSSFFQGDVVKDVPVVFLPDKISQWFLLRPNLQGAKLLDDVLAGEICRWFEAFTEGSKQLTDKWQHGNREEFVAAKAKLMTVVIVTQSCDLENRSYYQVAPVYAETEQKENRREQLRENNLQYAFYLPALSPNIPENSYADLSQISMVPKRYFPRNIVKDKLTARLTSVAITKLQEHLADYFGRPFGFSDKDHAKVASDYACIACFYTRAEVHVQPFDKGAGFTKCERCGYARWLRVDRGAPEPPQREPVIKAPLA